MKFYDILEVSPDASIDDIKKAAQKLTGVTSSSVPASETKPELKSNLKKEKQ